MSWKFLSSTTLSSATVTVTISGIPQGYTDLMVICSAGNNTNENPFRVRPNGDTSSNVSVKSAGVYPVNSPFYALDTGRWEMYGTRTFVGSTYWGNDFLYLKGYSSSNNPKTGFGYSAVGNLGGFQLGNHGFSWQDSTGISSLEFKTKDGEAFAIGTKITLYGILVS